MLGVKAVPAIGGIQLYTEEVGKRLVARGHEVTVYCRRQYMEDSVAPDYCGLMRRLTPGIRGKHLDALTHTATAAWHCRQHPPQIAHFHGIGPTAFAPLVRRGGRTKVVITVHGLDWQRGKWGRAAKACLRSTAGASLRWADAVTAVSRSVQRFYQEQFGQEIAYVPSGITPQSPEPPEEIIKLGLEPERYVLFLARLVPEKGCHYLLEAFRELDTDQRLVIAGGTNYRDPYVDRLHELADERVLFPGYVRGRLQRELYAHATLYVLPSDLEGLPLTVLEALSYGRCVLASDIEPNVEALGGCGYTFRQGDAADLRQQLTRLLGHPELVAAEREKAQSYIARERDWEKTTDAFEQLYSQL